MVVSPDTQYVIYYVIILVFLTRKLSYMFLSTATTYKFNFDLLDNLKLRLIFDNKIHNIINVFNIR